MKTSALQKRYGYAHRQAIVTKYLGPTNSRDGRIKATAQAGSVTVPWEYADDSERNHLRAAMALMRKLGWTGSLVGGGLPSGEGNCYVIVG